MSNDERKREDDLVKRLRLGACALEIEQAADRIEQLAATNEELEAKLATSEKYRDAYAESDRIGTQAVRDLEAKLAKVKAAFRINMMHALPDYTHEMFDREYGRIMEETDD